MALAAAAFLAAQEKGAGPRIDVEHYTIEADVNPRTQALTASVQVRFTPLDDNVSTAAFELNNALAVSRVTDETGRQGQASRSGQDSSSLRGSFPTPLAKRKPGTLPFPY